MLKLGIISNANSRRNRHGLRRFDAAVANVPDVCHVVVNRSEEMGSALEALAAENVELLVLNGGDGTFHSALTELLVNRPFGLLPLLAALPGGTNNTIATDINGMGRRRALLARLLRRARANRLEAQIITRHVIRLDCADWSAPVYGMFVGAAAIARGIEWRRQLTISRWIPESVVVGLMLAGWLGWRMLAGSNRGGILGGDEITVTLDRQERRTQRYLALMVTTMERLALHSCPYWAQSGEPLKFTSVTAAAPRLALHILPLLYGRATRRLPAEHYFSAGADCVSLQLARPFVVDGELFEPTGTRPVELSAVRDVRFVRC